MVGVGGRDEPDGNRRIRPGTALWGLRASAVVFLVTGFTESVSQGTPPVSARTTAGVLFLVGVVCAVVSIYLGIYLQRERE